MVVGVMVAVEATKEVDMEVTNKGMVAEITIGTKIKTWVENRRNPKMNDLLQRNCLITPMLVLLDYLVEEDLSHQPKKVVKIMAVTKEHKAVSIQERLWSTQ